MKDLYKININRREYIINKDEFHVFNHLKYGLLKIIPELKELERINGLINDLSLFYHDPVLVEYNPNKSGFTNIQNSKYFNKIILKDINQEQLDTIKINLENHKINNILLNNNLEDIQINILKINDYEFLTDEVLFFIIKNKPLIIINNKSNESSEKSNAIQQISYFYKNIYLIENSDKYLFVPDNIYENFYNDFHYFIDFEKNIIKYNNLLHLTMIVKNAGEKFENVLKENLKYIDHWTILDTGSTDGTQDVIKRVLKDKKGKLYEEPFINFKESRNRCLELAPNNCKYKIMLDDTYIIKGDLLTFLNDVYGDQYGDSFSLSIISNDIEYTSNRIIKSEKNLKYVSKIHEIIQKENNVNIMIPKELTYIYDEPSLYMSDRTQQRKELDLKLLYEMIEEEPDEPRHLYYLAQTYNCLKNYEKAAEYFKKRYEFHIDGFLEEKIDACFELARKYNYDLNYQWDISKLYYIKAYELDKRRPDALYYLGLHYYLNNDYKEAFPYLKRAFEIGFPHHAQYSVKPTLSYFFLPHMLSRICYSLGEYKLGLEASKYFLLNNKKDSKEFEEVNSWLSIYYYINNYLNCNLPKIKDNSGKLIYCYLADGGYSNWSGSSILNKGVGGAESYIIEMSRYTKKHTNFEVYVFCKCDKYECFEGVHYYHLDDFPSFLKYNKIHTLVLSRFIQYLPMCYLGNVENIHLLLEDLGPIGTVLPLNDKLKNVICLTEWHKEYFLNQYSICRSRTTVNPNGIDIKKFSLTERPKKIPFKFIYSSFAYRGLINILNMWDKILFNFPSATLHLYCDIYHSWFVENYPEQSKQVQNIIESEKYKSSIFLHGWVSKQTLTESWLSSQFWLYPCCFLESYCITALEAAASCTIPITNDIGALINTVGDRGLMISGDASTEEWQNKAIEELKILIKDENRMNELIDKNFNWAVEHDWENLAVKYINEHVGKEYLIINNK